MTHEVRRHHRRTPRRLRRFARVFLVAVPSFIAGAVFIAYLAADASRLFFQMLRTDYGTEEEIAAVCLRHRGDVHEAAWHYANVVSTYGTDTWWRTTSTKDGWRLAFPLAAILFRHMWQPEVIDGGLPKVEAMYRVRLANALMEDSQVVAATQELERAARLLGPNGESKVEALRENLPRVDDSPLLTFCRSSSNN